MIFGDVASGKSTFANRLGERTGLPVVHLDEAMKDLGRINKDAIRSYIREQVGHPHWIMDGNAFTKDRHQRIAAANLILIFHFNRFRTLYNWQRRYYRIKTGREPNAGGQDEQLMLTYYVPYILYHFPKRKAAAIGCAHESSKPLAIFRTYAQSDAWLHDVDTHLARL